MSQLYKNRIKNMRGGGTEFTLFRICLTKWKGNFMYGLQ